MTTALVCTNALPGKFLFILNFSIPFFFFFFSCPVEFGKRKKFKSDWKYYLPSQIAKTGGLDLFKPYFLKTNLTLNRETA